MPADGGITRDHPDPSAMLAQARRSLEAGDLPHASVLCAQAIAAWPDIRQAYRLELELARARGDRDATVRALEALLRHDAEDAESCASLGGLLCEDAAFERAAAVLRPVAARLGDRGGAMTLFATALAHLGAADELRGLRPVLAALAAQGGSPHPAQAHLASALLAGAVDRDRLLAEIAALQHSARWLDPNQALSTVSAAIASARPFSMLRLDASLAAIIGCSGRNAGRLLRPAERSALLDDHWPGWFGAPSREAGDAVLADLSNAVLQAIEAADLLGLPGADELAADNSRFGILAEMHGRVRLGTDAAFADTGIAGQMHRLVPYLRTALAGLPFLGFVGAHPAMFRKLAHFCGVTDTEFVPVPRAASFPVAEDGIDPRGFLPDAHAATLSALSVPAPGAVFLVSAPGPLGIVYAGRIKALGGIALEIGPLAAQWAGG